jgi:peptidoglycan/xylan/chitin deacetylase (PgdA/CDA1 family)
MRTKYPSKAVFCISLDTELMWGAIQNPGSQSAQLMQNDVSNGRDNIKTLLSLFDRYEINATWAVVGHLFLDRCQKENDRPHSQMPRHTANWYAIDPCSNLQKDPLFYGRDIIETILSSRIRHEIGLHTFSHVPFSKCSRLVAESEIKEGIRAASKLGIVMTSFVFPYNQIGHLDLLKANGFRIFRGQDMGTISRNSPGTHLPGRVLNRIFPSPVELHDNQGIWEIASSTIALDKQLHMPLVSRSKIGINRAIKGNKIFHICLHPHDLLYRPALANELDEVLAFVAKKRMAGQIEIRTMTDLAPRIGSDKEKSGD